MGDSPARTVADNTLVSTDLPPLTIEVDSSLGYVGRLQFDLYGVAEADVFVFAEPQAGSRRLKRWLIVQFEGYLDNNTHTYNYASPDVASIGSYDYMYDVYAYNVQSTEAAMRPDSDSARVRGLLVQKGYILPDEAIRIRFIRLLDSTRRRELLLIYAENLDESGAVSGDISVDGALLPRYAHLAAALRDRALSAFTVRDQ